MPVTMAFNKRSPFPLTAEQKLRQPADVKLGVTSTEEQMKSGSPPGYRGAGLMENSVRDEDGVDRVKEPPESFKPVLLFFKDVIKGESMNLADEMKSAGATPYGTISKGQFQGVLVTLFKRHVLFTDELLAQICDIYGTGLPDHKHGGFRAIAWKDFCEDIEKAAGSGMADSGSINLGGLTGGKTRNEDGTLDRVDDPPDEILKWLLAMKLKCKTISGVDLVYSMRHAGGKNTGLMDKQQFLIALKTVFREFTFEDWLLYALTDHYGVGGDDHIGGGKKLIAWKDFCQDVERQDMSNITPELDAINRAGCATLG